MMLDPYTIDEKVSNKTCQAWEAAAMRNAMTYKWREKVKEWKQIYKECPVVVFVQENIEKQKGLSVL